MSEHPRPRVRASIGSLVQLRLSRDREIFPPWGRNSQLKFWHRTVFDSISSTLSDKNVGARAESLTSTRSQPTGSRARTSGDPARSRAINARAPSSHLPLCRACHRLEATRANPRQPRPRCSTQARALAPAERLVWASRAGRPRRRPQPRRRTPSHSN